MNYKLAKRLKNAGFPQIVNSDRFESHYFKGKLSPKTIDFRGLEILGKDTVLIPTLSELIEECIIKDRRFELQQSWVKGWYAQSIDNSGYIIQGNGEDPEEAVAELWLTLNAMNI